MFFKALLLKENYKSRHCPVYAETIAAGAHSDNTAKIRPVAQLTAGSTYIDAGNPCSTLMVCIAVNALDV